MTTTTQSPCTRETATVYRGRPLIVKLCPRHAEIREKGRRFTVTVDYEAIYHLACKMVAAQARREREAARKAAKAIKNQENR